MDISVDQEIDTAISTLTFLIARYTPDAPASMPLRLVVKSPHVPRTAGSDSAGEAHFYRHVAPSLDGPPLVRCVAALDQAADNPETIVLEDLRATHDHPPWPLPPSRAQCERALDARALTVAHGDAHTWNFLFPRSDQGPAFLIDWQLWHTDLGARDLAFFMALHWYPGRRRELLAPSASEQCSASRRIHRRGNRGVRASPARTPGQEYLVDGRR